MPDFSKPTNEELAAHDLRPQLPADLAALEKKLRSQLAQAFADHAGAAPKEVAGVPFPLIEALLRATRPLAKPGAAGDTANTANPRTRVKQFLFAAMHGGAGTHADIKAFHEDLATLARNYADSLAPRPQACANPNAEDLGDALLRWNKGKPLDPSILLATLQGLDKAKDTPDITVLQGPHHEVTLIGTPEALAKEARRIRKAIGYAAWATPTPEELRKKFGLSEEQVKDFTADSPFSFTAYIAKNRDAYHAHSLRDLYEAYLGINAPADQIAMRTARTRELLDRLPPLYRELALINLDARLSAPGASPLSRIPDDTADALTIAFDWRPSPQGRDFWKQVRAAAKGEARWPDTPSTPKPESTAPGDTVSHPPRTTPEVAPSETGNPTMKAIRAALVDWLKHLPMGYANRAVSHVLAADPANWPTRLPLSTHEALQMGFEWGHTSEGPAFWNRVYHVAKYGGTFPELPSTPTPPGPCKPEQPSPATTEAAGTWTDDRGTVWTPPTAEAYGRVCRVLEALRYPDATSLTTVTKERLQALELAETARERDLKWLADLIGVPGASILTIEAHLTDWKNRINDYAALARRTPSGNLLQHVNETCEEPTGVRLIADERRRQLAKWDAAHDDAHTDGGLLDNAAILMRRRHSPDIAEGTTYDWGLRKKCGGDPVRELTVAGALVAAELDRRLRKAAAETQATVKAALAPAICTRTRYYAGSDRPASTRNLNELAVREECPERADHILRTLAVGQTFVWDLTMGDRLEFKPLAPQAPAPPPGTDRDLLALVKAHPETAAGLQATLAQPATSRGFMDPVLFPPAGFRREEGRLPANGEPYAYFEGGKWYTATCMGSHVDEFAKTRVYAFLRSTTEGPVPGTIGWLLGNPAAPSSRDQLQRRSFGAVLNAAARWGDRAGIFRLSWEDSTNYAFNEGGKWVWFDHSNSQQGRNPLFLKAEDFLANDWAFRPIPEGFNPDATPIQPTNVGPGGAVDKASVAAGIHTSSPKA